MEQREFLKVIFRVIGLEHIHDLVSQAIDNCNKIPFLKNMMNTQNLRFVLVSSYRSEDSKENKGDGFEGFEECAPYDCIHVGAAVEEVKGYIVYFAFHP